mmetsp:Transcript_30190/g.72959  ORF Transcript_30190/g.72959 Transcript_30190/m.72959 type:complete len:231 (-) Transcript_30190:356-1048(-)
MLIRPELLPRILGGVSQRIEGDPFHFGLIFRTGSFLRGGLPKWMEKNGRVRISACLHDRTAQARPPRLMYVYERDPLGKTPIGACSKSISFVMFPDIHQSIHILRDIAPFSCPPFRLRGIRLAEACIVKGHGRISESGHEIPQCSVLVHGIGVLDEMDVFLSHPAVRVEEVRGEVIGAERVGEVAVEQAPGVTPGKIPLGPTIGRFIVRAFSQLLIYNRAFHPTGSLGRE